MADIAQVVTCYRQQYVLYGLHDSTHVYIILLLMIHLWLCPSLLGVKVTLYQCQCQCHVKKKKKLPVRIIISRDSIHICWD